MTRRFLVAASRRKKRWSDTVAAHIPNRNGLPLCGAKTQFKLVLLTPDDLHTVYSVCSNCLYSKGGREYAATETMNRWRWTREGVV